MLTRGRKKHSLWDTLLFPAKKTNISWIYKAPYKETNIKPAYSFRRKQKPALTVNKLDTR